MKANVRPDPAGPGVPGQVLPYNDPKQPEWPVELEPYIWERGHECSPGEADYDGVVQGVSGS